MQPRRFIADNLIDASLVKCFSPLYKVLMFLGCSRISVKDQLVTTPTVWQKLYTLVCIAAFTFSFYYFAMYYYTIYYNHDMTMYTASIIGTIVQYASYLSNIIYTRFCTGGSAVKFCLKLQKVDNILAMKEFKHMRDQQYYWNLVLLVGIIVTFECGFLTHAMATVEYPMLTIFGAIGLLNVYVEIVLAACLIFYLAIRLRFLNRVVEYNFHVKCTVYFNEEPSDPIVVNESFIISADLMMNDSNKLDLEKFLVCLKELLKLYKIITEIFSFPVLNIATTLFFWVLLVTLTLVIGLRSEFLSRSTMKYNLILAFDKIKIVHASIFIPTTEPFTLHYHALWTTLTNIEKLYYLSTIVIVTTGLWFVYYFILITLLALVSDYFIQEVRRTKLLCIHAMSCRLEGPIWKGANDILRTIQFYQPTFSVYGIFKMDKKLPLSLIGMITTYLVILIQFTILSYAQN